MRKQLRIVNFELNEFIFTIQNSVKDGDMGKSNNIILEKSYQFAVAVIALVKKFTRTTEGFAMGNQLIKADTSIRANGEEAIGAFSKDDFIYKMNIALKEARETHYWLRLVRDTNLVKKEEIESVVFLSEEVMRIL